MRILKTVFASAAIGLCGLFVSACSVLSVHSKSGLQVMTDDIPAHIYFDGKLQDKTPYINKELQAGEYVLEIRPDDPSLATYQTNITLRAGILTVVTWKPGNRPETSGGVIYEMEPLSNNKTAELSLTTIPDGAIVRVDGQAKGFAPLLQENISAGEHQYEVSLPSYETQKHTINVLEGYRMDVTLKLAKIDVTATASATTDVSNAQPASPTTNLSATNSGALNITNPVAAPVVPKPKVHILATSFFVSGQQVLRVRSNPASNSSEVGQAPVGNEYPYLNQTTSGWYKISFNNQVGWVNQQYAQLIQ